MFKASALCVGGSRVWIPGRANVT